ncbi:hypothetical protein DPEC_G00050090 [Dallia pectoralis]|uniref:Uncharacterized protein n=1 Tax=Dallia pectoralis TaxID=75939 RepID=A0ACC2HAY1_DALPE|nr:hypothetical protein DPEC_G00050090 [Dallia pectoralis]
MAMRSFFKVIILFGVYCLVKKTTTQQYGCRGDAIFLTSGISGHPDNILWTLNENKVVEFDGTFHNDYGSFKGRTVLDWSNGDLTIKGLTDADSGHYQLEAVVNQKLQHADHEVQVIDVVAQPFVNCEANKDGTTLLCSADLHPLTQFLWRIPGGSETPGSELFIPVDEKQESVYTCVVKNPVSNKTAEFTLKECHTEEGSSVLAVVLPIFFILIFILCVLLAIWWWCQRKKKKRNQSDQNKTAIHALPVSNDEESLLLQRSSSTNPPDQYVLLAQNGHELNISGSQNPEKEGSTNEELESERAVGVEKHIMGIKSDTSVVTSGKENLQPPAHIDQPINKKVELDMQTSSTQGQAEIQTPLQDPVQPDPKAEDTKGDTQSNIQTKEPNQETETSHQTQEPTQETETNHQTQEPTQETETNHQTQEPTQETETDY